MSQSSEEVEEPSALEYARSNGLSRDYLAEGLGFADLLQLQRQVVHSLSDCSHLPQFNPGPEPKLEERLAFSKDAALLLSSVTREEAPQDIDFLVCSMLDARNHGWPRKLELPLLRSDHEADCRSFASREGFDIKLQDVKLPLEMVDDEKNEGLISPSRLWDMGQEILQRLKMEKLSVSKDAMMFLNSCLKDGWSEDDAKALWDSERKYKKARFLFGGLDFNTNPQLQNTATEPVTPPLSPAFKPSQQPYEPSLSDLAYQLPLLSDPQSPTKQELEAIEKTIFERDVPTPLRRHRTTQPPEHPSSDTLADDSMLKPGDVYSPLASMEDTSPHIDVKHVKREDLKVEEPLTPDKSGIVPPKTVRFSDIIEQIELNPSSSVGTTANDNKILEEAFGDALREANRRSEQEKLVAADAIARVDVPIMDFSKSGPPWKSFEEVQNKATLMSLQKAFMREVIGQTPKFVSIIQKDLNLRWTPFPANLAKVVEEDHFEENDQILETYLKDLDSEKVLDSSNLTWKPPGLRILKEDECDDEIELGVFRKNAPRDLSFLVKKRKMELEEADGIGQGGLAKVVPAAQQIPTESPTRLSTSNDPTSGQLMQVDPLPGSEEPGRLLGGLFSAENSLDNYLELRGSKKVKLSESTYFSTKSDAAQSAPAGQMLRVTAPQPDSVQLPIRNSPLPKAPSLPAPSLPAPSNETSVIVSSTLLKHRALVKHLERLLPALSLIERDFTAHNTTAWLPGSVSRSPVRSPLDSEADIIVSPSTGIVITTLQKIKQKPLPGKKTKPAIRDRLDKVSGRYEKLVVLVTEGRRDETTIGLNESDCLAYTEFAGFANGFETSIPVLFIAGGEETLSKWLASTIVQHCVIGESNLLAEETHWELFLRRAGLNAFAAQVILAELKAADGMNPASPTKASQFGLTAFVEMGREQRIARFGRLCGNMLMERVSAVIDDRWD